MSKLLTSGEQSEQFAQVSNLLKEFVAGTFSLKKEVFPAHVARRTRS